MLKVGIDDNDDIALRVVETGRERDLLAEISAEIDNPNRQIGGLQRAQQPEGIITAAVIYENDLARQRKFLPDN
jgi:hypothetical protein